MRRWRRRRRKDPRRARTLDLRLFSLARSKGGEGRETRGRDRFSSVSKPSFRVHEAYEAVERRRRSFLRRAWNAFHPFFLSFSFSKRCRTRAPDRRERRKARRDGRIDSTHRRVVEWRDASHRRERNDGAWIPRPGERSSDVRNAEERVSFPEGFDLEELREEDAWNRRTSAVSNDSCLFFGKRRRGR